MIDDKNAVKKHRCPQLQIVAQKKKKKSLCYGAYDHQEG